MTCRSILVVEDDEAIRESIVELLVSEGYTARCARNGEEALETLRTMHKPCLVLLDLHMPVKDGFQFLSEVRDLLGNNGLNVVVISALSNPRVEGVSVIAKPMDANTILRYVRNSCGEPPNELLANRKNVSS